MSAPEMVSVGAFLRSCQGVTYAGRAIEPVSTYDSVVKILRRQASFENELVMVAVGTRVEALHCFFAILAVGGVPVLVSAGLPAARLRELASTLRARAVIGLRRIGEDVPSTPIEECPEFTLSLLERPGETLVTTGEVVLLTSGTSGVASACAFDFDALLLNGERHAKSIGQRSGDTVLISLPLYYSFALVAQALASLVVGNRVLIAGQPFHPGTYRRILEQQPVSVSSLTPLQVRQLLRDEADEAAWSSALRVLTVGGDSLTAEDVDRLLCRRPGRELYLTYGLTEAGPRVSTLAAHDAPAGRRSSVGRPLEGVQVRCRAAGDAQELLVASATLMKRELGRVEGRSNRWAPGGFLATGDLFDLDEEGYLFFRGRTSDFAVLRGEKVCLASVRRVAREHPAVIGSRTRLVDTGLQGPSLELVLSTCVGDVEALRTDVMAHLRGRLSRAEVPGRLIIERATGEFK